MAAAALLLAPAGVCAGPSEPLPAGMAVAREARRIAIAPLHPSLALGLRAATPAPAASEAAHLRPPGPNPRRLVLQPLPEDGPPPGPQVRAMQSLARLDGAALQLGAAEFGPRPRVMHIVGELRIDSYNGPTLQGRMSIDLPSRRLAFQLPALQVVPRQHAGSILLEVRAILIDRRF